MVSNGRAEVFAASALKRIKKIQDAYNHGTFLIRQVSQNTEKFLYSGGRLKGYTRKNPC